MYEVRQETFWTPGGRDARMWLRADTNDWNTLNACMTQDEYGLRFESPTGLALDVGAYLGGVGIGLALDHPNLRVVMVEPVPGNAELIHQNVALNGVGSRCTLVEAPVGDGRDVVMSFGYSGSELATHHAFVGNMSLLQDYRGKAPHDELVMRSWTFENLADVEHGQLVDLLKIDCEGGEWAFLKDALERRVLPNVSVIVGEWHPTEGHTQNDMRLLLERTHEVTFSGPVEGPGGFRAVRR